MNASDLAAADIGAAPFDEAAGLAPGLGETDPVEQVERLDTAGELRSGELDRRRVPQRRLGHVAAAAEESRRRALGLARLILAVRQSRRLERQAPLGRPRVAAADRGDCADLVHRQQREEREKARHVAVVGIDPELVVVVGAGARGIEPDGPGGGLAHLRARGGRDQREGDAEGRRAAHAADQVDPGDDVPPLVAPAHLEAAALVRAEVVKVVGLQEHVVELEEVQAVGRFEAGAVGLGGEHAVHRELAPDVAQKLQVVQRRQPVGVVHQQRLPVREVDEARQLPADGLGVRRHLFARHHAAQLGFSGRVADQAGAAADQRHRAVAGALQVNERHDRHQAADVQARGGRVEADVRGGRGRKQRAQIGGRLRSPGR